MRRFRDRWPWARLARVEARLHESEELGARLEAAVSALRAEHASLAAGHGALGEQHAALASAHASLESRQTDVAAGWAALGEGQASLARQHAALGEGQASLARQQTALREDQSSLERQHAALGEDQASLARQHAALGAGHSALLDEVRAFSLARLPAAEERLEAVSLDLRSLLLERVPQLEQQTAGLVSRAVSAGQVLAETEARVAELRRLLEPLWAQRVPQLEEQAAALVEQTVRHLRRTDALVAIAGVTAVVRAVPLPETLVSVILPTRDRGDVLPTAIASVRAQTHDHWELVVIDDGSSDGTAAFLASLDDPRVRVLRTDGVGPAGARNRGLAAARGRILAYLDDDNVMSPDWLRAVAWAFSQHPDRDVLYGAQVVEERDPGGDGGSSRPAWQLRFEPWDPVRLADLNFVDLGALAHRAGLSEARFDETVPALEDWDLILRLTRTRPPLRLPVLCGVYRALPVRRISDAPEAKQSLARMRSRVSGGSARPRARK